MMITRGIGLALGVLLTAGSIFGAKPTKPSVTAKSPEEAGRYLVVVAGCMDCHTPGWLFAPGKIPEAAWLTGWDMGWRGPWGTSYPRNLRNSVAKYSADQWIKLIKSDALKPPMPSENLKMAMSDEDFKSIYAYIKSLGAGGKDTPEDLPPEQEPKGPYISMMPINMPMPPGGMPPGAPPAGK